MVKTPFCLFDLKTGVLCPRCQALIDSGKYSMLDFEISRALYNLENKGMTFLKNIEFEKSYLIRGYLFVVLKGKEEIERSTLHILERRVLNSISNKNILFVKVILDRGIKSIIEQLIFPAKLITINIKWFPDGSSLYTVRVSSIRRLRMNREILGELLKNLTRHEVEIISERSS